MHTDESCSQLTRTEGKVIAAFNAIFIALIPLSKVDLAIKWDQYRPISYCNRVYKLITKIIASHIKPLLSSAISPDQFAFLIGRQIHDDIEMLKSVELTAKIKCLLPAIPKVYLTKA